MSSLECDYCGNQYNPIATRWRCTACGLKSNCCEGEMLSEHTSPVEQYTQTDIQ
jgi:hypothetical protein